MRKRQSIAMAIVIAIAAIVVARPARAGGVMDCVHTVPAPGELAFDVACTAARFTENPIIGQAKTIDATKPLQTKTPTVTSPKLPGQK